MSKVDRGVPLVVLASASAALLDQVELGLRSSKCLIRRYGSIGDFVADERAISAATVFFGDGYLPITRDKMLAAPRLTAIISPFTGTEGFDEAAATDLGIVVANGQIPENVISMAEATILMILASLYNLRGKENALRSGGPSVQGRMLRGKTLGLLGFGAIAQAIVDRLLPWGLEFLAYSRRPPVYPSVLGVGIDELLGRSDILCVLAPLNDESSNLLTAERLALTKKGSTLVVMSRGGIVDEDAVARLAAEGHFGHVAFDVFSEEPCSADNPLLKLDNAVLTPHSIGHTVECLRGLPKAGAEAIRAVLEGRLPSRVRNPGVTGRWRGHPSEP